jgi:hypothetical protein
MKYDPSDGVVIEMILQAFHVARIGKSWRWGIRSDDDAEAAG